MPGGTSFHKWILACCVPSPLAVEVPFPPWEAGQLASLHLRVSHPLHRVLGAILLICPRPETSLAVHVPDRTARDLNKSGSAAHTMPPAPKRVFCAEGSGRIWGESFRLRAHAPSEGRSQCPPRVRHGRCVFLTMQAGGSAPPPRENLHGLGGLVVASGARHDWGPAAARAARTKVRKLGRACRQVHKWAGHLARAPTDNPAAATLRRRDPLWWRPCHEVGGATGCTGPSPGGCHGVGRPR